MNFLANMVIVETIIILKNRGVKMIKKVDHIGIAVRSLGLTLPFYTEVLNLPLLGIEEVESQKVRVAFLKAGETKLELLEPTTEESTIAKFIEKRGEGIHHVALGVDCIEARIQEMNEKGITMIDKEPRIGAGGAHIAFMHPKPASGVLVELCEKKG
jgi:methylmalonyl-CoA/ethylmalonyl-CoA epimerase